MEEAKLARDNTDNLTKLTWFIPEQGMRYWQMSRKGVMELAEEAGALGVHGRRVRINRPKCDEYLLNKVRFDDGSETE